MDELRNKKIFVAGHRGLVGSALVRSLRSLGCENILTVSSSELDLRDQAKTRAYFLAARPQVVFLAAARVGGILANNTQRADFLYDNIMISINVIEAAFRAEVDWLLNFGSSCIYPKMAPQPIKEEALLTGPLESTNEPYAIAKIAAMKLVENYNRQYGTNYFSAMPTNLYGPFDNFNPDGSHVIPALMRRFHEAKISGASEVTLWGDGSPKREFLHSDDLAAAALHLYGHRQQLNSTVSFLNVGYGDDLRIEELALKLKSITEFTGAIHWDATKPNGTPRKLSDSSKLKALGWKPTVDLDQGLRSVYAWFQSMLATGQLRN